MQRVNLSNYFQKLKFVKNLAIAKLFDHTKNLENAKIIWQQRNLLELIS